MSAGDDPGSDSLIDEAEVAQEFLEGILDAAGLKADIVRTELENDLVELALTGDNLAVLIGPRGQTLAALQELTRTVVQRQSRGRAGRVILDIGGYRKARREALEKFTIDVANQVMASGVARVLEPMSPPDRKVVHDTCNNIEGVRTVSEGEDEGRRVVIMPVSAEESGD